MNQILSSTNENISSYATTNSTNWAGYEYHNSGGVTGDYGSWSVPTVSAPSTGCGNVHNSALNCTSVFWIGETVNAGGTASGSGVYLDQGGTLQTVKCSTSACSSITTQYAAFYEFVPSVPFTYVPSSLISVSANDGFTAFLNYTTTLGGAAGIELVDANNGNLWSVVHSSQKPYYGQFIVERPLAGTFTNGSAWCWPLPKFTNTEFDNAYFNSYGIYGLSPSSQYVMTNPHISINIGPVSNSRSLSDYFTVAWATSSGTNGFC
ncbi:MAG: hypothetical protein ACRDF4_06625 [Rhabdochlamydiaceae bacterium]